MASVTTRENFGIMVLQGVSYNRASSRARLPTYARLGVPEVWQYRGRGHTMRFLQRIEGRYQPTDRSLALPVLTPERVLEALNAGASLREGVWLPWLQEWSQQFRPAGV